MGSAHLLDQVGGASALERDIQFSASSAFFQHCKEFDSYHDDTLHGNNPPLEQTEGL
jgi:hypothetical protein